MIVEIIGLSTDAVSHGLLGPEVEPQTRGEMARHLLTVHFVLYVGVVMLFLATAWAVRRSGGGRALRIPLAGVAVQLVGEIWHAYSHLQLQPNPWPEVAGFVGLAVVLVATIVAGRGAGGAALGRRLERRPQGH